MDNRTSSNKPLTSGQKYVGRAPRACDSCRKMKVKCHLNGAGPCRNCQAASRPCTFDALGVKREKPPPKREVQKLKSKLSKFERFLESVAPGIDLTNLPETTEDAKYIVENFKSFNSASKKKDNLQSVGFCKPEKNELIGLWPSPSRLFHGSFGQPLVEKHMQELHTRYNDLSSYQPPNDLAQNLLDLYFRKINVFEHILHEGEFLGNYYTDLAKRNTSFRALTFAVYAAAARFCPDPRVCPIDEEGKPNREAAGALYLSASAFLLPPPIIPSQAVGAHRENSQRWSVSMMKDQLRKKAMWYLISREMQLCMCLGRGSSINQKYVDIGVYGHLMIALKHSKNSAC
ncbi:hypothetical protein BY996DRAFT_4599333 [Phakopsora pachyrhizi]|nr:hypothetical protein BY996DRAFT_4599333 [Phakopsora pachyrhizi]